MDKVRVRLILLVAVLSVILGGLIGGVAAKYTWSTEITGTVTFSAKLAEGILLKEHKAGKNLDGSYTLDANTEVSTNAYTLLPGLDIPKDPFITVSGKTPIEAYLFVEVAESADLDTDILSYTLDDHWTPLSVSGKNGGNVYVYNSILDGSSADLTVNILKGRTLTVSQKLKTAKATNALTFYGFMAETAAAEKGTMTFAEHAAKVYQTMTESTP